MTSQRVDERNESEMRRTTENTRVHGVALNFYVLSMVVERVLRGHR